MSLENKEISSLELAIQEAIGTALKEVHTCLPAIVVDFDPVTQLIEAQPTIKRKIGNELVNFPVLQGVPVRYPKSGQFSITWPLVVDDEVLLIFCERSIDLWLTEGEIKDPFDVRRHSLSDAFALPLMYNQTTVIPAFGTTDLELKSNTGTAKIAVTPTTDLVFNSGSDFAVQFTALQTAFNELKAAFNTHTHTYIVGSGITATPLPQSAADISLSKIATIKVP